MLRIGKHGDDVIIAVSVNDDDAKANCIPERWKAPKPYIRIVKQPV